MTILDAEKFQTKVNDVLVIAPCIEIVLLLDTTIDEGLIDFYQRAREVLGERITHYQAESMKGFSKLTARAETMVPTWFTNPRKGKLDYHIVFGQGDLNQQATASTIHLSVLRRPPEEFSARKQEWADTYAKYKRQVVWGATTLRLTLPLDHPLAEPDKLIPWILDLKLVKESSEFTGYCGLALNAFNQPVFPSLHVPAQQAMASLVLRHPGFGWEGGGLPEISRYEPETNEFRLLVKRANWLNLICDNTLACLGGRASVQEQVKSHPEITVYELKHGLAIKAGDTPQIGDIGHRDFIPAYQKIAKIIRPVRIPKIGGHGAALMSPAANEWLNAFDKEYA
jgi:hypothetical protein